uniref:Pectin lyase-like superfamily protein n=1 Tax=Strongyloides papillosus TaxID=174720 RepID=A0A0N5CIT7_STREA
MVQKLISVVQYVIQHKKKTQCEKGEKCVDIPNIDDANVKSCVTKVECIDDVFLKCTGSDIRTRTTTTIANKIIVTAAAIVDKVLSGAYGCEANLKY